MKDRGSIRCARSSYNVPPIPFCTNYNDETHRHFKIVFKLPGEFACQSYVTKTWHRSSPSRRHSESISDCRYLESGETGWLSAPDPRWLSCRTIPGLRTCISSPGLLGPGHNAECLPRSYDPPYTCGHPITKNVQVSVDTVRPRSTSLISLIFLLKITLLKTAPQPNYIAKITRQLHTLRAFSKVSPLSNRFPIRCCVTGKFGGSLVHLLSASGLQPFMN